MRQINAKCGITAERAAGTKEKAHHHHDVGYTGEVWYQEGPRRNGGKQVRAVPGLSLSYKDKEIKPPEKC